MTQNIMTLLVASFAIAASGCVAQDSQPATPAADSFRVASFNVHYVAPWQTKLAWDRRKAAVSAVLQDMNADIVAFQEMETFAGGSYNVENRQLEWVLEHLPHYAPGAVGDPRVYPSTQPILYKRSRFEQLAQGFFFFSETPAVIYSRTFNGSYPAFCSWSRLRVLDTGQVLTVLNVHYDYRSFKNKRLSNALVAEHVRALLDQDANVIVLGDINAFGFSPTAGVLKELPLSLVPPAGATFHFNRGINVLPAIDHIFVSGRFAQIGRTWIERRSYDGVWPADHYPVWAEFRLLPSAAN